MQYRGVPFSLEIGEKVMRCPFCGGLNSERASFCAQCGRDLPPTQANTRPQPVQRPTQQPPYQPVQPVQYPPQSQQYPPQSPYLPKPRQPVQAPAPRPPQTQHPTHPVPQPQPARPPQQTPVARPTPVQAPPPKLEAPTNFPPRTIAQLKSLQAEPLPYTLVGEAIADGHKKIVRVVYGRCASWQQVATLLQAFKEQSLEKFDTILIQGVLEQDKTTYAFTNGQLQYDRGVRLGSQTLNRFQIETGNGFESDSVRIVVAE